MSPLFTVKQFAAKVPAFTVGGLRTLIFNGKSNGIVDSGAIIRIDRKVLINENAFQLWVR
jgi:hypothetical protein